MKGDRSLVCGHLSGRGRGHERNVVISALGTDFDAGGWRGGWGGRGERAGVETGGVAGFRIYHKEGNRGRISASNERFSDLFS